MLTDFICVDSILTFVVLIKDFQNKEGYELICKKLKHCLPLSSSPSSGYL